MPLQETEIETFEGRCVWRATEGKETKCAGCGLALQPGELVTRGMVGVSKAAVVCKFCRPFRPFYVPGTASTLRILASNEAGHHVEIIQGVYPDGSPALILRNWLSGSWTILVSLDDAQQVAESLVTAAVEMRGRIGGENPKARPGPSVPSVH